MPTVNERPRISFHFHPFDMEHGFHAVEKEEGGKKRRYLEGIASGLATDGHGERMTAKAIQSFQRQAESGDVLLYEGLHGVNFVDDIGRLTKAEITPTGDWKTTYRLYDEQDKLGAVTLEKCDKVWRQLKGLPPYTKPKQKGYSIEGEIPENGILSMDQDGKRTIDDVHLDGVVLVNRPAYKDSIAHAVYKALGIDGPWKVRKTLTASIKAAVEEKHARDRHWEENYLIDEALRTEVQRIMTESGPEKGSQIKMLLSEYADLKAQLILSNPEFYMEEVGASPSLQTSVYMAENPRHEVIRKLAEMSKQLAVLVKRRREETNER